MQPSGSLCGCHQSDFHPGHCGRSFAPSGRLRYRRHVCFLSIRGGGVRKASVSRSFRARSWWRARRRSSARQKEVDELARREGRVGPHLHRLFQRAFRVAKQVRTHTQITRGAVSVGSVAVDLAEKIFGALDDRKVLVLGAGENERAHGACARSPRCCRSPNRQPVGRSRAAAPAALVGGRGSDPIRTMGKSMSRD